MSGPKTPKAPPPPKPPAPTQAYENFAKSEQAMRQRRARGYASTIIGGYANAGEDRPQSLLKTLLGG